MEGEKNKGQKRIEGEKKEKVRTRIRIRARTTNNQQPTTNNQQPTTNNQQQGECGTYHNWYNCRHLSYILIVLNYLLHFVLNHEGQK